MPSTLEQQYHLAVSRGDFVQAHALFEQLSAECSVGHLRFLRADYRALLSPSNYPEAFAEMVEIASDPDTERRTALYACVEASRLAFRMFDSGRMRQLLRVFSTLRARYRDDPQLVLWTGPVLLNEANLAAQTGYADGIPRYRAAIRAMAPFEQFWCYMVAACARLAVEYEYRGKRREADRSLAKARSLLRGDGNRQEVVLAEARILFYREQFERAELVAIEGCRLAKESRDYFVVVESLRCAGEALLSLGRLREARIHLAEAREIALAHSLYHLLHGFLLEAQVR